MGQHEIYAFLKQRPGKFLSVNDIASGLNMNIKAVNKVIIKLQKSDDVVFKEVMGANNRYCRVFSYLPVDTHVLDAYKQVSVLRQNPEYKMLALDTVINLCVLAELKELKELIINGKKEGCKD